ncbi:hypothetical protein Vadar_023162 [Vaccinium darrowii]|uniref:Uncharacterized protein n=1 Tax=Vaccinium darrowii TaxID=229202 RepID=A0ACB7Y8J8_9ERIC|nr:hypothetical protein Vadar_023162 [Vaccinium darrowii]
MAANPSTSVVLLLLLSLLTAPPPVSAKLITSPPITFSNFTSNDNDLLQVDPSATINDAAGALQVTLDTGNPNHQLLSLANVRRYSDGGAFTVVGGFGLLHQQEDVNTMVGRGFVKKGKEHAWHKHLVPLQGWCHNNGKLLLVYDYMPNLSLDKHLFSRDANDTSLGWNLRCKIILGVASALDYLHNDYQKRVLHRDLKASNIMLDAEFNAKLGDFGLARAVDNGKSSFVEAEGFPGTRRYIAPECLQTCKATQQSDVYAFGAVLLEVVCGRRPGTQVGGYPFLVDWVWSLHREGQLLEVVDSSLGEDNVAEEAQRFLLLGLACSHPIASERPKTKEIVQIVLGSLPVPLVPPFKPPFVWASVPIREEDISLATTADTTSFEIPTTVPK